MRSTITEPRGLEARDLYDEADLVNEVASRRRTRTGPVDSVVTHLLEAAEALRAAARELESRPESR